MGEFIRPFESFDSHWSAEISRTPPWFALYKSALREDGHMSRHPDARHWDAIWTRCGRSKLSRNMALEDVIIRYHKDHYDEATEHVGYLLHLGRTTPFASTTVGSCATIMKRGREYAWSRLVEIGNEAVRLRLYVMYYKEMAMVEKTPHLCRIYIRKIGEFNTAFETNMDLLYALRNAYFSMYPPSVPAPSATETAPSSPASSAESAIRTGPRNTKKRVIEDEIEPTQPDLED